MVSDVFSALGPIASHMRMRGHPDTSVYFIAALEARHDCKRKRTHVAARGTRWIPEVVLATVLAIWSSSCHLGTRGVRWRYHQKSSGLMPRHAVTPIVSSKATSRWGCVGAGASAAVYACDGDIAATQVDVIAKATATAMAESIASADVFCEAEAGENGFACGLSEANVRTVAEANVRNPQPPPPSPPPPAFLFPPCLGNVTVGHDRTRSMDCQAAPTCVPRAFPPEVFCEYVADVPVNRTLNGAVTRPI